MNNIPLGWIRPASILSLALLLIGLDFLAGPLLQMSFLYILPIGLAAWYMGERWGLFLALALASVRSWLGFHYWHELLSPALLLMNLGIRATAYILLTEFLVRHARLHRLQKQRLDLILENLPVGVGLADQSGNVLSINPSGKAIWGIAKDGPLPDRTRILGWRPGSDRKLASDEWALARTLQTGQPVNKEVVDIETFDGGRKTILTSTTLIKDESDHVRGAIFVNQDMTDEIRREREREALVRSLEEALASNRVLKGLLPICASCKNIRDDDGYWNRIEDYLRTHSDVLFSHGICPECAARLYPEYAVPALPPGGSLRR
jgi:PAS domain S-box-containing protein